MSQPDDIQALIEAKTFKIASSVALRRDFDLLKVLQMQHSLRILDTEMISLSLFDIYRGVFTSEQHRVKSSGVTSEVQAAAKLSLLNYLLHQVTISEDSSNDMRLKAFMGDLVTGIHQEIVSDGRLSSTDYKEEPQGLDQFMGAQEYSKVL